MTGFNINEYVWVRLTDDGWRVHDQFYRLLHLDAATYRAALGEDWQRFQLWELMEIFGPETHMGQSDPYFEGNEIHFSDPALEAA